VRNEARGETASPRALHSGSAAEGGDCASAFQATCGHDGTAATSFPVQKRLRVKTIGAALAAGVLVVSACHKRELTLQSRGVPKVDVAALHLKFVTIPAGRFRMGTEESRSPDQAPVHDVTISRPFDLQTTEVTQAQWVAVMGSNPSQFHGDALPVEQIAATDVDELLRRLNGNDPGRNYRLPTETEWEYACRAGSTESRYGELEDVAWSHLNSGNTTHAVGTKRPNAWGLYDMLGNV
jgi:formylglycine-generating enzyme required for sulfatase activity